MSEEKISVTLSGAEKRWSESERLLRLITDALPVLISYVDAEHHYRFANRGYMEWFGLRPEAVTGRHLREVLGEAAYEAILPEVERALSGQEVVFERLMPYQDSARYIHVNYVPDRDGETGAVKGFCALVQDISESKLAEDRLRESEARFAKAFSASPLVLTLSSLKTGKILEVNETFVNVTGFTREEAVGKTTLELGLWARPQDRELEMETVRQTGRIRNVEYLFRVRDGKEILGLLSAEHIDIGGESYALTVIQDITERKREELDRQFLLELGEKIRYGDFNPGELLDDVAQATVKHLNAARCLFIEINEPENRGTIVHEYCRPGVSSVAGAYRISDYSPATLAEIKSGRTIVNTDSKRDARTAHIYETTYEPNGERAYVSVPLFTDGRWTAIFWISDDRPRMWEKREIAFLETVGERTWLAVEKLHAERAREELLRRERAARQEAEEASRLKDEFLATISHELRTPLTAILGWAHMLKSGDFDEDDQQMALETIYRNAKSQAQLIEDILDVSRIITGKLRLEVRPVPLAPVIQRAVESLRPAIEAKNIALQASLDTRECMVLADPNRLQQVVWNLLSNAVKFTPERGEVYVNLEHDEAQTKIVVKDSGEGISQDFLPYVFERFRQADGSTTRKHGGLGLGLSIVRHIVELHGGTVEAASQGSGRGATFVVQLPVLKISTDNGRGAGVESVTAAQLQAGNARSIIEHDPVKGLRVLLIDDEKDTLDLLAAVLARSEAEVRQETSVRGALETIKEWRPRVIICDIAMPEEDGYSFIKRLRALPVSEGGAIPVIALTAHVGTRERADILSSGFQIYLPKPVEPSELLASLTSIALEKL